MSKISEWIDVSVVLPFASPTQMHTKDQTNKLGEKRMVHQLSLSTFSKD